MPRFDQPSGSVECPDGATLRYQVHGAFTSASGVPIVLHSGATQLVQEWDDLPQRIAEHTGQQVITYDPRGFGRSLLSPEGAEKISLATYAADLATLLQILSIPVVDLMGWSMGAWVVGTLLGAPETTFDPQLGFKVRPEVVVRQALLTAFCIAKTNTDVSPEVAAIAADSAHPDLTLSPAEQWSKLSHNLVRTFYPSSYPEQSQENKAKYDAMVRSYLSTPQWRPLDILLKQSAFTAAGGVDIRPGLSGLPPPAQARIGILTCPDDLLISPQEAEATYLALPFARSIRLPLSTGGVVGHIFWHAGSIDDWAITLAHFFRQGNQLSWPH